MAISSGVKLFVVQLVFAVLATAGLLGFQYRQERALRPQPEPGVIHVAQTPVTAPKPKPRSKRAKARKRPDPTRKGRLQAYNMSHAQNGPYRDLAKLDPDRSPHSESWNNSIALCACMLQENATDVREWLLYHRWLGIDHVYLTENSNPPPEHLVPQLQDFIDEGFLTFQAKGKPAFQQTIYLDCMKHHRHKYNWMAFIDLDEFIFVRKKDATLKEFLDGFKLEAALALHWVLVGPSGQEHRPTEGGVLRHYRNCDPLPNPTIKSVVNTWYLLNTAGNPHNYEYRDNRQGVDENHRKIPWKRRIPEACTDGTIKLPKKELRCRGQPEIKSMQGRSADKVALFHFVTRSKEDFMLKTKRGGGASKHRDWSFYDIIDKTASKQGGVCEEPSAVADDCCPSASLLLPSS